MDADLTPAAETAVIKDDPAKPWKAYVATGLAFVTAFAAAWIADDGGVTQKEVVGWVLTALAASGITGAGTYLKSNPKVSG